MEASRQARLDADALLDRLLKANPEAVQTHAVASALQLTGIRASIHATSNIAEYLSALCSAVPVIGHSLGGGEGADAAERAHAPPLSIPLGELDVNASYAQRAPPTGEQVRRDFVRDLVEINGALVGRASEGTDVDAVVSALSDEIARLAPALDEASTEIAFELLRASCRTQAAGDALELAMGLVMPTAQASPFVTITHDSVGAEPVGIVLEEGAFPGGWGVGAHITVTTIFKIVEIVDEEEDGGGGGGGLGGDLRTRARLRTRSTRSVLLRSLLAETPTQAKSVSGMKSGAAADGVEASAARSIRPEEGQPTVHLHVLDVYDDDELNRAADVEDDDAEEEEEEEEDEDRDGEGVLAGARSLFDSSASGSGVELPKLPTVDFNHTDLVAWQSNFGHRFASAAIPLPASTAQPLSSAARVDGVDDQLLTAQERDALRQAQLTRAFLTPLRAMGGVVPCVRIVATSGVHCLALTSVGTLYSWGTGRDGALGHADTADVASPRLVETLLYPAESDDPFETINAEVKREAEANFIPILVQSIAAGADAAGRAHSAAVRTSDARVLCWGVGGATGLGHTRSTSRPALVGKELSEIQTSKAALEDAMRRIEQAKRANGRGDERAGEALFEFERCAQVECGGCFTLARMESGAVYSWGKWAGARLGLGPTPKTSAPKAGGRFQRAPRFQLAPKRIGGSLQGARCVDVACGEAHALAVDSRHRLHSWGRGLYGQLGAGSLTDRTAPRLVDAFQPNVLSDDAGIDRDGESADRAGSLVGAGGSGAGGDGAGRNAARVEFDRVACGMAHSLAIDTVGRLFAWGGGGIVSLGNCDGVPGAAADRGRSAIVARHQGELAKAGRAIGKSKLLKEMSDQGVAEAKVRRVSPTPPPARALRDPHHPHHRMYRVLAVFNHCTRFRRLSSARRTPRRCAGTHGRVSCAPSGAAGALHPTASSSTSLPAPRTPLRASATARSSSGEARCRTATPWTSR
jgi:alpha-tubulin suppressor-like RCC1 family protein